jgi:hypothetical protein
VYALHATCDSTLVAVCSGFSGEGGSPLVTAVFLALERFVRKEPLRWTHESVFGVLALESEPVDQRL